MDRQHDHTGPWRMGMDGGPAAVVTADTWARGRDTGHVAAGMRPGVAVERGDRVSGLDTRWTGAVPGPLTGPVAPDAMSPVTGTGAPDEPGPVTDPVTGSGSGQDRAGRREWAALAVLALAVLLIAIDGTVLGLAVPFLSRDLRPTGTELLWIVDVYSFVLAGLLVTMGTLGDRIGRRRLLLVGAAGFGAASVLAAYAWSPGSLIAARALLGVAGATIMPSTLALVRNLFRDARQRTVAIGIWSAMAAAGASVGPLLGGWLLEHFWWGSVFLINLPIMAALLLIAPWLVPESRHPVSGRFDLTSALLSLAAVLPVVYGLKRATETGIDTTVVAVACAGMFSGIVFVRRQRRLTAPLLDVGLFADRVFSGAVAINLLAVFALVGGLFFGSQFLQLVVGLSPLEAGRHLLPGTVAALGGTLLASLLARRLPVWVLLATGLLTVAAGFALMTGLRSGDGPDRFVLAFCLVGVGVGLALTLTNDAVLRAVPASRAGAAAAVAETAYELGTALGVAILGSILAATYRREFVAGPPVPAAMSAGARESLGGAVEVAAELPAAAGEIVLSGARAAFVEGMTLTSGLTSAIAIAAAVVAITVMRGPVRSAEDVAARS